jgi:hypothetical protein
MTLNLGTHESTTPVHAPAAPRQGLGERLVSALLSIGPSLRLHRATGRHRSRGSPPRAPRLRKDLGLPEIIEPAPDYWHHP